MTLGWSWEYIDEFMTIPRLKSLTSYWKSNPPVHVMMANYFGIGGQENEPKTDMNQLISELPKEAQIEKVKVMEFSDYLLSSSETRTE